MKITITICILFLCSLFVKAQETGSWFAFEDEDTNLIGFKDATGEIKIEPKYMGLTTAFVFNNVIAVMEEQNDSLSSYYLLKNGKKFGPDSLYTRDMAFDCESDGLIRFRDSKSDKVGFFDSLGAVVIPAIYNDASPFRNGLATAITGAKKICWDGREFYKDNPCEHWDWEGGQSILIDKENNILIENFEPSPELDWYSVQIIDTLPDNSLSESFKGVNGKFYNFINIEKHFRSWLFETLLTDLNKEKLINNSYNKFALWEDSFGWIFKNSTNVIDKNFEVINSVLGKIRKEHPDYFISLDELNPFIYESEEFEKYYDDCGNAKIWLYPVLHLIINRLVKTQLSQDHFEFLRTDDGYKLISITIGGADLKF